MSFTISIKKIFLFFDPRGYRFVFIVSLFITHLYRLLAEGYRLGHCKRLLAVYSPKFSAKRIGSSSLPGW